MSNTFNYGAFSPSEVAFLQTRAKRVRALIRRTTHQLIEIGENLTQIKERMPHGQFAAFCDAELGIKLRSAENYMSLAELAKTYPPALVARLPARAGYKLGERSAPTDKVAEIMREVSNPGAALRRRASDPKRRRAASSPSVWGLDIQLLQRQFIGISDLQPCRQRLEKSAHLL
ncbi:hypothetical protein [Bradyrhizobium sp. 35]|uniref:hypothetical protein n=1 Tax=Bradyrhizobium sp. 35 TaxID=2782670 RepID=UPI001FF970B5|nr:hypothetical protein [Bradyrhizobium sp. 35]